LPSAPRSQHRGTRVREMLSPSSSAWDIGVRKGGYRQSNIRVLIVGELAVPELPISEARACREKSFSGAVPRERRPRRSPRCWPCCARRRAALTNGAVRLSKGGLKAGQIVMLAA
jgi:hypothetical protein